MDSLACGGAEKSLVSLLSRLDNNKMDIDLLLVNRNGVFEQALLPTVRRIELPVAAGWHMWVEALCRFRFSVRLRLDRWLGRHRHGAEQYWETMHAAFTPLPKTYDVAVAYHQGFPTYYVATKVDAGKKYAWVNIDLKAAGYRVAFNRPFYDRFDGIAAVSDVLRKMLECMAYIDKTKLCTVYDILDADLIRQLAQEPGFEDSVPAGSFRIVTAGRMTAQKNYILAVETAARLKAYGLSFRWYFIGDGPERQTVERLIGAYALQEDVILLGMQPNPYPYMAGCDIYVQTSVFEGFCLTLREARLLNRPVVSTPFPVVHDQLHDGVNGLIADMTAESLAEKILLLAESPEWREKLMAATRLEENRPVETEVAKVSKMLLAE